jgi:hypothetical protein
VTVDELIQGVNIALDRTPATTCPEMDANGNMLVSVDELVGAVNNLLAGCS